MGPCALRCTARRRCERGRVGAPAEGRRRLLSASRSLAPGGSPSARARAANALRRDQRAGQQRRPRAALEGRSSRRVRRQLRRSPADQSAGAVLPHPGDRPRSSGAPPRRSRVRRHHRLHHVGVGRIRVGQPGRVLREQGWRVHGGAPFCGAVGRGAYSGLRSSSGYHRDRHDRGGEGRLRQPHRGRPRARTAMGPA